MSRARLGWSSARCRPAAARGLLASLLCAGLACRAADDHRVAVVHDGWRADVVYAGETPLRALAAAELDPAAPGEELVAVGAEGALVYVARRGDEYASEVVAELAAEPVADLRQVAIGEVDQALPGLEVIVVGARAERVGTEQVGEADEDEPRLAVAGVAWQLVRGEAGFEVMELHRAAAPLTAVLVADVDPTGAGNEVVLAGEARELVLLLRTAEGFEARTIAALPGVARAIVATGAGLVVACDDGSLVWLARPPEPTERTAPVEPSEAAPPDQSASAAAQWTRTHVWRADGALTALVAHGGDVLVCCGGMLRLLQTAAVERDVAFVRETRCLALDVPLHAVAFADIDAREAGDEAAAIAEDGTVHVVRLTPWPVADDVVPASAGFENYRVRAEVAIEEFGLRALAAGRFAAVAPGTEDEPDAGVREGLACTGESGRIIVVTRVDDDGGAP